MTHKITLLLVQTLFFFLAITIFSFFAEVVYMVSKGNSFGASFSTWYATEFVFSKTLLRFAASALYVLFRNRRMLFNRQ
ncbi:hypothetical protein [Arundinibacter roseus]|uniref:Uncharacterized protein n=1 Tax=Arundinibacter roseus TaxID=2070510 RepID=A0A4R4KNL5_9BACT|nr:hypothetical protein [Arundinibacter roseus]TDB68161.1 hypothetical protein EZE20_04350 [Arundinibacter roseus]